MTSENRYWFPAKRYGWGWGLPITWQGWVAFAVFLGLVAAGTAQLKHHPVGYVIYVIVLSVVFACICWWKGEPARWRWGDN
jgi:hypothetical protein